MDANPFLGVTLHAIGGNRDWPEFADLLGWMRTNIYVHGSKYTPAELVERVTGGPIRTEPFLNYVRNKYTEIYQL